MKVTKLADDAGAFREDALDLAAAAAAAAAAEDTTDALMQDLLGSMERLSHDEQRRLAVARLLV